MNIAIYTLGCKVNQYETAAMERELTARGHTLVPFEGPADACIINTCTVTAVSDKKSRQMIRRARKQSPGAVVAVCGCYPQTHPEDVKGLDVDLIAGTGDRMKFLDLLEQAAHEKEPVVNLDEALCRRTFEVLPAGGLSARTRAMLKVEDGCVNFCSYCIIPYARGPVRSLPLDAAVREVRRLRDGKYRSWAWTWGRTPAFVYERSGSFAGMPFRAAYSARQGIVAEAAIDCPAVDGALAARLLNGARLCPEGVAGTAGLSGAPDHYRGLLPPDRRPAQSVPSFPPVPPVRLRRHAGADEPEV